jgi:hypothetical protein
MLELLLSALLTAPPEETPRPPVTLRQLPVGLSAREVRRLLGPPRAIARQGYYLGRLEQWVYERPLAVRIEFLGRAGQELQIQSVQTILLPRP